MAVIPHVLCHHKHKSYPLSSFRMNFPFSNSSLESVKASTQKTQVDYMFTLPSRPVPSSRLVTMWKHSRGWLAGWLAKSPFQGHTFNPQQSASTVTKCVNIDTLYFHFRRHRWWILDVVYLCDLHRHPVFASFWLSWMTIFQWVSPEVPSADKHQRTDIFKMYRFVTRTSWFAFELNSLIVES